MSTPSSWHRTDKLATGLPTLRPASRSRCHGNVIDANETLARIVDRTPAEIGNANLFELTHPEDQSRHRGMLEKLLASEIPGFVIEKRYLRPDGSAVWVRNSVSLVNDEQYQIMPSDLYLRRHQPTQTGRAGSGATGTDGRYWKIDLFHHP